MADIDWGDSPSTSSAVAPAPPPATGSIDWGDSDQNPAKVAIDAGSKIPPEQAAKVLNLADKTKLSPDFVSRNVDALQTQQNNAVITPEFSQQAPVVTRHAAEDPHQAALVAPDANTWNWLERQFNYMSQSSARGFLDIEHGARSLGQFFGETSPQNEARIKQIEMEQQYGLNQPPPGPISKVFGGLVESAPAMVGAMGAGGVAAAAGAGALGASAATAAGWGALEVGKAFRDFSQRPGMDATTARGAALVSGALQGALFMLPAQALGKIVPAGLKMVMPEGIASIIQSPTLMQGMGKMLVRMGEAGATMGGFSGLSTLIHSASGHLAEMVSDGTIHTASPSEIIARAFPEEDIKAAGKSGVEGAEGGLMFGGLTGSMEAISDYRNFAGAMKTKESWDQIGKAIESTKMQQVAPEQVEKLVSKIAPDKQVYIPLEHWQQWAETQKVDPRAAFQELAGNTKAYDDSLRTGADLQLPAAKYAAKIAPSEHAEVFNNVVRSDPMAMNADEAQKSISLRAEMEETEAKNKIREEVAPKAPEKEAEELQGQEALFPRPTAIGMTAEKAARYKEAIAAAHGIAQEEMVNAITTKELKQKSTSWLAERETIQKQVEQEASQHPEYRDLKDFPGLTPEQEASIRGFNSVSEMEYTMKNSPKFKDFVKQETDQRMLDRHPEVGGGDIMQRAMEAVHNDKRAQVLRMELEHLASDDFSAFKGLLKSLVGKVPQPRELRSQAEDMIASKTTAETNPGLYQRGESVSGREAKEYFLQGDFQKSFEAKKQELLNHELFRAATAAKEQTAKDIGYVSKFDSDNVRARIGKAGGTYLEQIDSLRERFDFGRATNKELERRQSLRDFVDEQKKAGYSPAIPEDLLNEASKKSWKEMTNDELHSVVDSMRVIDHLSGLKNKLLAAEAGRDYSQTVADVTGSIQSKFELGPQEVQKKIDLHPSLLKTIGTKLENFEAWRTKMEFMFRFMDGGEYHGPAWETFMKPMNDAEDFKTSRMREASNSITDIFKDYSRADRAKFYSRLTYIPEIDMQMNKMDMMMTALHWGNEGNRAELLRGYGWTEPQVQAIWKNLEPRDLEAVNKIWKHIDSYWPEIAKQERELNGLVPEKIQASPFEINGIKMDGGYFPLTYDKNISWRTAALGQDEMVKDLFSGGAARAATKHGWTNERVGGGGQAPSLNMTSYVNHVADVIHDLAYRKSIIDAYKLLNDPQIRSNIEASAGKEAYKQLNPWLKRIAGDRPWNPLGPLEGLSKLRANMTAAELGLKVTSAAIHTTSILTASRELGPKYTLQGMKESANIVNAYKRAADMSEFMRSRPDNFDRDIKAAGRDLNIAGVSDSMLNEIKQYSPIKREAFWSLMRGLDLGVATPTWWGAYKKAMDGGVKNIEEGNHPDAVDYADQLVRDTKGSGSAKDLAPLQSAGGQLGKLFTMFYTQLNVIDNQMMMAKNEYKSGFKNAAQTMTTAAMVWFLPAAATEALRGRTPKDDESWGKWLLKAEAMYPINAVWGLNEFVNGMIRGSFSSSPVFDALSTLARTAKNIGVKNPLVDRLTDSDTEWTDKDYQDALMSVGYTTGLPTRQALKTTQYLYDWMTGAEQPDNPMEGAWRTLVGKKAK